MRFKLKTSNFIYFLVQIRCASNKQKARFESAVGIISPVLTTHLTSSFMHKNKTNAYVVSILDYKIPKFMSDKITLKAILNANKKRFMAADGNM